MRASRSWPLLAVALLAGGAAPPTAASEPPALRVEEGSVARRQLVAIGRDLVVEGEALGDVAVVNGRARIGGRVAGGVVVLGGDALLTSAARVEGDLFVLGGHLELQHGARVEGRSVSYPTVSAAWITLLEGPSLGLSASSPVVLGAKLALLAAWLGLGLVLLATGGRQVLATSAAIAEEGPRNFFVGLTGVVALFLTALFFTGFAAALVGLPMLVLVVLLALLLKLWGMVAVFHAVGDALGRRLLGRRLLPSNALLVGLLVLGSIKMLPWVGTWVWTVASLVAVGASLTTKFGRREPWFEIDAATLGHAA